MLWIAGSNSVSSSSQWIIAPVSQKPTSEPENVFAIDSVNIYSTGMMETAQITLAVFTK